MTEGIEKILVPRRARQDGVLTVHDNMLYVQCLNRAGAPNWRCEAAGLEGEPWLRNVLTRERQDQLIARGFRPDAAFGNFVATFPRSTKAASLAATIRSVLTETYGAGADDLLVLADWLPSGRCHPRFRSGADRGGSIGTPHWGFAKDLAPDCRMETNTDSLNRDDPGAERPQAPPGGPVDLDARYAVAMAAQIKRLESGQKHIWAIFDAGIPYVQCQLDKDDSAIYCEAASEEASGKPLGRILTPERRQKLIEAGFELPGKVINFSRLYPLDHYDETAVARALLAVLRDGYGYAGAPGLILHTEKGDNTPL